MLLLELFEAAQDDLAMSKKVDDLRILIHDYVYGMKERGEELAEAEIFGANGWCLFGADLPSPPFNVSNVMFFWSPEVMSKCVALDGPVASARNITKIVMLNAGYFIQDVTRPLDYVTRSLSRNAGSATFRHEVIHLLDYSRVQKISGSSVKLTAKSKEHVSAEDLADYHNEPLELNAYFHNIAEPLLLILRMFAEEPLGLVFLDPLPATFREYWENLPSLPMPAKRHLEHISPENRKRLISRLNALFNEAKAAEKKAHEMMDAGMAKKS